MTSLVEPFVDAQASDIECINFTKAYETANIAEKARLKSLITQMHDGLYCETFPIETEQEDVSVWIDLLEKGAKEGQHIYTCFGRNLNTVHPEILGFVIADIGADSNCGLIEYVVRKKGYTDQLSGKSMLSYVAKELNDLNMQINGQKLKGIFWEANDPAKIQYDENNPDFMVDCMAPQKRIDLIQTRYGARLLGFDYTQGPLEECKTPQEVAESICSALKLFQYNAAEYKDLTAKDIKNYICCFNKVTNNSDHPRHLRSPEMDRMMNQLDLMIEYNIPVLEEKQTADQKELLIRYAEVLPDELHKKVQEEVMKAYHGKKNSKKSQNMFQYKESQGRLNA